MKDLLINQLEVSKFNMRTIRKNADIEEIKQSIRSSGIIEPLIVRKYKEKFEVVVGQRRFLAAKELKLKEVPCVVKELSDQEALSYSLIENLQRSDVDPIDVAEGLKKLYDMKKLEVTSKFKQTHKEYTIAQFSEEVSKQIGLSDRQVREYLSLTNLTPEVQELVSEGKLTIESGSKLKQLPEEEQKEFAEKFEEVLEEKPITQIEEERIVEKVRENPKKIEEIMLETKEEMNPQNITITLNLGNSQAEFKMRRKYYDYLGDYAKIHKTSVLSLIEKIIIEKLKEWGYKVR